MDLDSTTVAAIAAALKNYLHAALVGFYDLDQDKAARIVTWMYRQGHCHTQARAVWDVLKAKKLREIEEDRPYWHWRAMLEKLAAMECEVGDCPDSDQCITEWCVPCASKRFLTEIRRREWIEGAACPFCAAESGFLKRNPGDESTGVEPHWYCSNCENQVP